MNRAVFLLYIILYKNNNRVKKIGTEELQWNREKTFLIMTLNDEKTINDNKLSFQFIEINPSIFLRVLDIYKGDKYNDTCIAELNIFGSELI
jgi:hypothetical protein